MKTDLISREYLKDAFDNLCSHNCKTCRNFRIEGCSFYRCALIDNAPTVKPQKVVMIPPELIEKLASCVVNTIEEIDWEKAIEKYKERPQGEWVYEHDWVHCSSCGHEQNYPSNFCPNCGAEMLKGEVSD